MSLELPSEYTVFTRDIAEDDPNLSAYGISQKNLLEAMQSGNIYLDAWDAANNFEIAVTMSESEVDDFSLVSDAMLESLAPSVEDFYTDRGITVEEQELYQHSQTKFIRIHANRMEGMNSIYSLQYATVCDQKLINITLHSYSGKIDPEQESILQSVVDSVHFDNEPLPAESAPQTEDFWYQDKETGLAFLVPANWTQKPLLQNSKYREYIDATFTPDQGSAWGILYGRIDIWEALSSDDKRGLSRSDLDNSFCTAEELAEIFKVTTDQISMASYGGKEYFRLDDTVSTLTYGLRLEVPEIGLLRIENGYLYIFGFLGDSDSPSFEDFESLLESVKYPAFSGASFWDVLSNLNVWNFLLNLLFTAAFYTAPIVVYRYGIADGPVEKSRAKKATIIYGVLAFLVMTVLRALLDINGAATAVFFWSFVNYAILTSGKKPQPAEPYAEGLAATKPDAEKPAAEELAAEKPATEGPDARFALFPGASVPAEPSVQAEENKPASPAAPKILYCRRCGAKLLDGSYFCSYCGTQVKEDGVQ